MKLTSTIALLCCTAFAATGCASAGEDRSEAPSVAQTAGPQPTVELPADPPAYGVQITHIDELRAYVEAAGVECDTYSERDVSVEGAIDFRNCNESVVLVTFDDYRSAFEWYSDRFSSVDTAALLGDQFAASPNVPWCVGGPDEITDMLEEKLGGVSNAG